MSSDYPIQPVPFTQVAIRDGFWKPRIDRAVEVTIPYDFEKCEETGRIDNFAKAGGLLPGAHQGIFYDDSDVFKVVEGAAYALQIAPKAELDAYLDDLIAKFAAAQEDDGYLYTARTIDPANPPEPCGPERWSNLVVNHELYNVGHMYEAAVAHFEATGKRAFLDIALKNADLIDSVFGADKLRDVPGHQEIELGLARLHGATGDPRYLRLAKFFLDERGQAKRREIYGHYCQDHLPVIEQREAVGHAVRAGYQYAAMTDIAAMAGDQDYAEASQALWRNVVEKKLALTGGIGARHDGEAFGDDYELPNLTAYNETCAALANVLWNQRLFQLTGDPRYIDVLERSLYNGFLAGVGMDGRSFFYVNPLSCDGEYRFNRETKMTRQPWYETSCCPTNIVRLLPSLGGYIYAQSGDEIFVNLYIAGEAKLDIGGVQVRIRQTTNYPWDGAIALHISCSRPTKFRLKLRLPAFAQGRPLPGDLYRYLDDSRDPIQLRLDGVEVQATVDGGYLCLEREWQAESRLELDLPMRPRRVVANDKVEDLRGMVALERGPVVYALEEIDNAADVLEMRLSETAEIGELQEPDLLGGVVTLAGAAVDGSGAATEFKALPYYAWGHRGEGKMTVWMRRDA